MSALPVTRATRPAPTFEQLCDALAARHIILNLRAARVGRLEVDAPAGTLTPAIRAALALHTPALLAALNAPRRGPLAGPCSLCPWGAPHFHAWRYHAGERRLVCAICYPHAWDSPTPDATPEAPLEESSKAMDSSKGSKPPATGADRLADRGASSPEDGATDSATGGAMMRLERDADGHIQAVPGGVTYFETIAADRLADRLEGLADGVTDSPTGGAPTGADRGERGPAQVWRIWRATDSEPGDAPTFESFDSQTRALWFTDALADDSPEKLAACREAWARLCAWIAREYPGCHAMRTPGATGLELIHHALPWGKGQKRPYQYATLPGELARLLAATAPQHRTELLTIPGRMMRRYTQYDARIAYAAYMRRLPVLIGEDASGLIHDEGAYIPYRAGKYRVAVTVPRGWAHVGLVHRAGTNGYAWEYPATPGDEWEAWLDESELRLLANNPLMPWPFETRERILFDDPKTPGNDPLREHVERLTGYLENIERERRHMDADSAQWLEALALRNAARAVALHPVGLWHKRENEHTRRIASLDDLTPEDADARITPDGEGGYTVTTPAALSTYQSHWRRLEWSTTVLARERVTVTRKALEAPRASALAIDGDALHLADYAPDAWAHDTGKVGAYRLKADVTYPRARRAPASLPAVRALGKTDKK